MASRLTRIRLPHPLLSAAAGKLNHPPLAGKQNHPPLLSAVAEAQHHPPLLSAARTLNLPLLYSDAAAVAAGKQDHHPLLSAYGSMFFNSPLPMPPLVSPHATVRCYSSRFDDEPSDGSFMCFACYERGERRKPFDRPSLLKVHYLGEHSEVVDITCHCGASFQEGKEKHGCVLRENESFAKFKWRMERDRYIYGKKMYKCPARGCQELCRTPLELHLHHLQRH